MFRFSSSVLFLYLLSLTIAQDCTTNEKEECSSTAANTEASFNQDQDWASATSIYDFHARDINGSDVPLSKYRGHVAIIANVASKCGLTHNNYLRLSQFYEKYSEKEGLRILAFPSNEFGGQEPGTAAEILDFVSMYNVTFDMFEKIKVNGDDAHPLWKWLRSKTSGLLGDTIKWNFTKFLINKEGEIVKRYSPHDGFDDLENDMKELLQI